MFPVLGCFLFEEVESFGLGDLGGRSCVALFAWDPDATALAAGGLAHEAELVCAGDGGGVDLDHLGVAVSGAELSVAAECRRLCR